VSAASISFSSSCRTSGSDAGPSNSGSSCPALQLLGELLVVADVDVGQDETAVLLLGEPLDQRLELLGRGVAGGPEVEHDRDLGRELDHPVLEVLLGHVEDQGPGGRDGGAGGLGLLDLAGAGGTGLLRLLGGLTGRLDRGEVDRTAHGHIRWLHGSILPCPPARV